MTTSVSDHIAALFVRAMELEGRGETLTAKKIFYQAWDEAANDLDRITAAHFLAWRQNTVPEKLEWDRQALRLAQSNEHEVPKEVLPSLYLNVAKGLEALGDLMMRKNITSWRSIVRLSSQKTDTAT